MADVQPTAVGFPAMNKIIKPEWLLFAEKVRVQINNMKPTKSGKREADRIYGAWLDVRRVIGII